jgi:hypothetical protein
MARSPARTATLVAVPAALLAGALAFGLLGGVPSKPKPQATGPVSVAAPPLDERAAPVCRALSRKLPDALRDRPRRPVTAGPDQNAAFGDPPIVLSCGATPGTVPKDAQLFEISGVCWFPEERPDALVWTTVDRQVPVIVTVPAAYDAAGQWVAGFSAAIVDTVPSTEVACVNRSAPPSPR